jgi:hypothetical protein
MFDTNPAVRPSKSEQTRPENLLAEWERPALRRLKASEAQNRDTERPTDGPHDAS